MSEPRTFEEWRETTSGWTEHELELAELAWNDSRAALLADRPNVAWLIMDASGAFNLALNASSWVECKDALWKHTIPSVRRLSGAIESLAAQLAAREEEVKRLREALEEKDSQIAALMIDEQDPAGLALLDRAVKAEDDVKRLRGYAEAMRRQLKTNGEALAIAYAYDADSPQKG